MRILTWNINGVRTLPQYHPWNTLKTYDDILNHLEADIICFQEMKSSRASLPKHVAVPPSYTAFFSFPIRKSGYSGVATYTRTPIIPVKAEEGLCNIPPLKPEERVSNLDAYPQPIISHEDKGEEEEDATEIDYKALDSEGRTIVTDLGLFVLINVYCPNDGNGTEERDKYKADFHRVLEARVKGLVEGEGREVIVVGDLNACAAIVDHCEGPLMVARGVADGLIDEDGFWGKDVRRWLRDWIINDEGPEGRFIDIVRRTWPDRKGMYTCWNTKISARETNYGTRIDYILITPGLLPWVKGADIQPDLKGSDHCPVYLDLHDEITNPDGVPLKLLDLMGNVNNDPPRLASKYWDEHSGKQTLLQSFFTKKGGSLVSNGIPPPESGTPEAVTPSSEGATQPLHPTPSSTIETPRVPSSPVAEPTEPSESSPASTPVGSTLSISQAQPPPPQPVSSSQPIKRKLTTDTLVRASSSKKRKTHEKSASQTKLATFFAKPKTSSISSSSATKQKAKPIDVDAIHTDEEATDIDVDADYRLAVLLSQGSNSSQRSETDVTTTKQAWSSLLAPVQPPKCTVHGEVAKELTVNKPGPNKGKKFFTCARPVGPGYDKGRTERLREHVDPTWKCDFFKWSSDVRREMRKGES